MNCLLYRTARITSTRTFNHKLLAQSIINNHSRSSLCNMYSTTTSTEKAPTIQVSPVTHDPSNNQFTCDLVHLETKFKGQGILSYQKHDQDHKLMEYDHVQIPSEFKGHDLGKVLANAAFDHALNHGWKLKVTCPYLVRKYLTLPEVKQKYSNIVVEPEMK